MVNQATGNILSSTAPRWTCTCWRNAVSEPVLKRHRMSALLPQIQQHTFTSSIYQYRATFESIFLSTDCSNLEFFFVIVSSANTAPIRHTIHSLHGWLCIMSRIWNSDCHVIIVTRRIRFCIFGTCRNGEMAGKRISLKYLVGRTSKFGRPFYSMTVYYKRPDTIHRSNGIISDGNMDFAVITFLSSPNYGPRLD